MYKHKKSLIVILIFLHSCVNGDSKNTVKKENHEKKELKNKIEGTWMPTSDVPEGFLFKGDSVFYPDKNEWFPYYCTDEIIVTEYYGSKDTTHYKMLGVDTLLFITKEGIQINIRQ